MDAPLVRLDGGAALSVPNEALILVRMYIGPGKPAYSAAFQGEEDDGEAPADRDALPAAPHARLLAEQPGLEPDGTEMAELLEAALTRRRAAPPDAACDAATVGDKPGGLPLCRGRLNPAGLPLLRRRDGLRGAGATPGAPRRPGPALPLP